MNDSIIYVIIKVDSHDTIHIIFFVNPEGKYGIMSYTALYRKWRPLVFEDVVEQEHVVKALRHSVAAQRVGHAYLFCGTRGTGKTTMAHIFSRAINCLSPKDGDPCNQCEVCRGILDGSILDVIEIDAASNNSVDNIRDIRDEVIYSPSHARYKVYIIDEVHMLSTGAFNALLKTLEEPPSHVVFILATTEPHRLPATILSRCQRYDFRRISVDSITGRLRQVMETSGITFQEEALRLIARMSDGALRDALSILDQCISMGGSHVSYDHVLSVVGIVNDVFMTNFVDALINKNIGKTLDLIEDLVMSGKDISQFVSDLIYYCRNLLICKITNQPSPILEVPDDMLQIMRDQSNKMDKDIIIYTIKELSTLESNLKWTNHPRVLLEVAAIKLCDNIVLPDKDSFLDRLSAVERKVDEIGSRAVEVPVEPPSLQRTKPVVKQPENPQPKKIAVKEEAESAYTGTRSLKIWPEVLEGLKKDGKMVLYSNLTDTDALELDDGFIGIVFGGNGSFAYTLVSRHENLEIIQQALENKLGREVRVKCFFEDDIKKSQSSGDEDPRKEFVEKAVDLAGKLNVPYKIIDE